MVENIDDKNETNLEEAFLIEEGKRISIGQYNKEIDDAMARIDAGQYISQEDLEKEAENW
ncbi:MAG: hypothetical protein JWO03_3641 [Bacteroidetes bacterium]|nr:hypothetical protein [Bacteroidota bacterium]